MRLRGIALAGFILSICSTAVPVAFASPPPSGRFEQRRIAVASQPAEVLISDDLSHIAVTERYLGRQRLSVDGKVLAESDAIAFPQHDGPLLGNSGTPVVYARADRGRWRLVVNGVAGPECDEWIDLVSARADKSVVAYTAVQITRKAFVAIDGQPGPIYEDVTCPVLSPDRTQIAYVACTGQESHRKWISIINGRTGPEYDQIAVSSSGVWVAFSADGKRTAYAARRGRKWQAIIDGQAGPQCDEIAPDSLAFSPDGRRAAYAAKSGRQWRVVLDGEPGQPYDRIGPGPIRYLSGSKDIAYTALAGSKWLAVVGGEPPIACDEIAELNVTDAGRQVAIVLRRGDKWQAVIDGHAGPEYDWIGLSEHGQFWVSPQRKRVAYAGRLGSKWQVVVDGRPDAACDEIEQSGMPFHFSPDGKRTAYVARIGAKWFVVIDGQPGPALVSIAHGSFEFNDDSARTAYAASRDDKWQAVVDGQPGPTFGEIDLSSRVFSLGGARAAYAAERGGKWRVVVNGEEGPEYDDVSDITYSPDGRRMAYVAGRIVDEFARDQALVIDGKAGPWYRTIGARSAFCGSSVHVSTGEKSAPAHESDFGVVFSPDSQHVAYPAGSRDEVRLILDGKPGPAYYRIGTPVFSADGKRLAYRATVGGEDERKQFMVIDGQPGSVYDSIEMAWGHGGVCFTQDGKHTVYAGRKAGKWHAVVDGREGRACDTLFGPGAIASDQRPAAFASWCALKWREADHRSPWERDEKLPERAPHYDDFAFAPIFFGASGEHVAYVGIVETEGRVSVVADAVPGPQYAQIGKPVVSDDGRRVAYIGCHRQGDRCKFVAVIDGREGPEYDEIPLNRGRQWEPFSHGGKHAAYMARAGDKWLAIVDGRPGPEYDEVDPIAPASWYSFFSDDGGRTAYFARRGSKWRAVIDGHEETEFEDFDKRSFLPLAFSPDGKHVAYVPRWGHGPRGTYRVIIDGRAGPEYEARWVAGPIFSPDSRHTAYVGGRDARQFVVLDGKELEPHDSVDGIRLRFSPDSQRLAYIAYRGKEGSQKAHFVVDGQQGPEHGDHIWNTYFSPDSKHAAYIAIDGRWQDHSHTEQLVVDGKAGPVVGRVEEASIRWSSDSQHLAYVANSDGSIDATPGGRLKWAVLDGKEQSKYPWVRDLAFSSDGKHLAYIASPDWLTSVVVRDGRLGPAFAEIEGPPLWARCTPFTPDGCRLCYEAAGLAGRAIILDNQAGPQYRGVLCNWFPVEKWPGPIDALRRMPPRILPSGAIEYPAVTADNPAEVHIVTQWPSAEAADPGLTDSPK